MKLKALLFSFLFLANYASADLLKTGTITRFNVSGSGNFGIHMSGTGPCSETWFYASKANMDPEGWSALLSLALLAYTQKKEISIFGSSTDCAAKRFSAIDTID